MWLVSVLMFMYPIRVVLVQRFISMSYEKAGFGLLALLATFTFIKSFDEISTHVLKTHRHVLEFLI